MNTNFIFIRFKSRDLSSTKYVQPRYSKYGFHLCADGGALKFKTKDLPTNLARKYFSNIVRSIISKSNFGEKIY